MNMLRLLRKAVTTGALAGVVGLAACDFEVTNPGPVQDEALNLEGAHQGIVNGAIRGVQEGFGQYALLGGALTHDLMASGHTGSAGVRPEEEVAELNDLFDGRGDWGELQRARWIAEEAVRRFSDADLSGVTSPSTYPPLAQAYFWAGLANRYLGENACTAVFDGAGPEPKLAFFDQAIDHFNNAETVGRAAGLDDMATAAIGARAAAKLFKGDFSGARSDAGQLDFDFVYQTEYSGFGDEFYNMYAHVGSLGFQSLSYWGTPPGDHFLRTGDERVAFGYDNGSREVPEGKSAAVRGQTHPARPTWVSLIPMYYPLKGIAPRDSEREFLFFEPDRSQQQVLQVDLVDGREMELIIAEADLQDGNWQSAMTHINNVRTATSIYAVDMSDQNQFDLRLHPDEQVDWDANGDLSAWFDQNGYALQDFSAGGFMDPVTASSLEEAWAALKFERMIELTMEGRRMGDRWRWRANSEPNAPSSGVGAVDVPGALHPLEYVPTSLAQRYSVPEEQLMLCFPMPRSENDSNQNIDATYKDWIDSPGYAPVM